MNYLFETKEIGDYRINVFYDELAGCPCQEFDMAGIYIWQYDGCISSSCDRKELFGIYGDNNHDLRDALKELVCDYVSQTKICEYINKYCDDCRLRYDKSDRLWYLETLYKGEWYEEQNFTPSELKDYDWRPEICELLTEDDFKSLLHDCEDIAFYEWSSCGYCQGEYVDGFAYCDKERFAKRCDTNTKNWRERAISLFEAEIKEIGIWMWGDACRYTLEKKEYYHKSYTNNELDDENGFDWVEFESVGGYYMDADDLIEEVIKEHGLQEKSAA